MVQECEERLPQKEEQIMKEVANRNTKPKVLVEPKIFVIQLNDSSNVIKIGPFKQVELAGHESKVLRKPAITVIKAGG